MSYPTQLSPLGDHLLHTLLQRPYVFTFFLFFLIFGFKQFGKIRTFLFLILGFVIAYLSEYSSIRNSFPYGLYHYVYENMQGELILWGVPLWDSLSYTFLSYSSYSAACFYFSYPLIKQNKLSQDYFYKIRQSLKTLLLASFTMMGIDIIIDPLTVLGDQWFLGRIYYYPEGGLYFGVPLSNFVGWFLTALAIIASYQLIEKYFPEPSPPLFERWQKGIPFLGILLLAGVFAFIFFITLYLKQWKLAFTDLILLSTWLYFFKKRVP